MRRRGGTVRRLMNLRPWRRHSQVLAVAGLVYIAFGLSLAGLESSQDRVAALQLALSVMPLGAWGIVWIIVGLLAMISTVWPPQSETWGYAAMSGMSTLWGSFYLLGMPFRDSPTASVPGVLVFFLMGFLWWGISGLWNPDALNPRRPITFDWSINAPKKKPDRLTKE